jgi:hypothetical protein
VAADPPRQRRLRPAAQARSFRLRKLSRLNPLELARALVAGLPRVAGRSPIGAFDLCLRRQAGAGDANEGWRVARDHQSITSSGADGSGAVRLATRARVIVHRRRQRGSSDADLFDKAFDPSRDRLWGGVMNHVARAGDD